MSGKGSKRKEENDLIKKLLAQPQMDGMEVFFSHFRIGPENRITGIVMENVGYATMALAVGYDACGLRYSTIEVGWSFCSPKDQFRASRGRLGAARRLVSRKHITVSLGERTELPKKDVKVLATAYLHQIIAQEPPPWMVGHVPPLKVTRLCLCGPKTKRR